MNQPRGREKYPNMPADASQTPAKAVATARMTRTPPPTMIRVGAKTNRNGTTKAVTPPERLVWLHSVSDADWNIIPNPMMADWPRVLLTTVTFEEEGAQTRMRLTWVPHEASDAETACFAAAMGGMDKGWGAGMELLAELLAELRA